MSAARLCSTRLMDTAVENLEIAVQTREIQGKKQVRLRTSGVKMEETKRDKLECSLSSTIDHHARFPQQPNADSELLRSPSMSMPPHARNLWATGAAAVVRLAASLPGSGATCTGGTVGYPTLVYHTPEAPRIGCISKLPQILEHNTRVSEKSRESLATFYNTSSSCFNGCFERHSVKGWQSGRGVNYMFGVLHGLRIHGYELSGSHGYYVYFNLTLGNRRRGSGAIPYSGISTKCNLSLGKANNSYTELAESSIEDYRLRGILPRQNTATTSSMRRSMLSRLKTNFLYPVGSTAFEPTE
ncbi:hypothetical protein C8R47DRAFT_1189917 [Mycena vitilis]|nr:hypothetical protein C8R47DRAFT_1189917 [Mycena vitilis]